MVEEELVEHTVDAALLQGTAAMMATRAPSPATTRLPSFGAAAAGGGGGGAAAGAGAAAAAESYGGGPTPLGACLVKGAGQQRRAAAAPHVEPGVSDVWGGRAWRRPPSGLRHDRPARCLCFGDSSGGGSGRVQTASRVASMDRLSCLGLGPAAAAFEPPGDKQQPGCWCGGSGDGGEVRCAGARGSAVWQNADGSYSVLGLPVASGCSSLHPQQQQQQQQQQQEQQPQQLLSQQQLQAAGCKVAPRPPSQHHLITPFPAELAAGAGPVPGACGSVEAAAGAQLVAAGAQTWAAAAPEAGLPSDLGLAGRGGAPAATEGREAGSAGWDIESSRSTEASGWQPLLASRAHDSCSMHGSGKGAASRPPAVRSLGVRRTSTLWRRQSGSR
jgi:hypothetical protein